MGNIMVFSNKIKSTKHNKKKNNNNNNWSSFKYKSKNNYQNDYT